MLIERGWLAAAGPWSLCWPRGTFKDVEGAGSKVVYAARKPAPDGAFVPTRLSAVPDCIAVDVHAGTLWLIEGNPDGRFGQDRRLSCRGIWF
jgi:hypothetical protein